MLKFSFIGTESNKNSLNNLIILGSEQHGPALLTSKGHLTTFPGSNWGRKPNFQQRIIQELFNCSIGCKL